LALVLACLVCCGGGEKKNALSTGVFERDFHGDLMGFNSILMGFNGNYWCF
jgi:hypothetical protein